MDRRVRVLVTLVAPSSLSPCPDSTACPRITTLRTMDIEKRPVCAFGSIYCGCDGGWAIETSSENLESDVAAITSSRRCAQGRTASVPPWWQESCLERNAVTTVSALLC